MSAALNLDPKVRAFVDALDAAGLPAFDAGTPADARRLVVTTRAPSTPVAVAHISDHVATGRSGTVPVRLYRPVERPDAAIVYLHGGGWVLGGIEDFDAFARALANRSGCAVFSVGYRLAPEAPYPAAIEDSVAALAWIAAEMPALLGVAAPIVLLGDSAGGNLAAVVAAHARDGGGPAIAAQVLAYPVTDAAMDTASYATFADGPLLTASLMRWFWDHYAPNAGTRGAPSLSPLRGNPAGLPPAFVLTAENDVLRDEGEAYAAALGAAGVPTLARRYEGQIHGFLTMIGVSDGSDRALGDIADFIHDITAGNGPHA